MLSKNIIKSRVYFSKSINSQSYARFSDENKDLIDKSKENKPYFSNTYKFFNLINPSNQDWSKFTFWRKKSEKIITNEDKKRKRDREFENVNALGLAVLYILFDQSRDEFMFLL